MISIKYLTHGRFIMAIDNIILFLFVGGFIGWALFLVTFIHTIQSQRSQLVMIESISTELKKVRQELQELK